MIRGYIPQSLASELFRHNSARPVSSHTRATRVYLPNLPLVLRLLCDALEDALGHGRPADVAQANEQHRHGFRHDGRLRKAKTQTHARKDPSANRKSNSRRE